jgi:hypothetical protein
MGTQVLLIAALGVMLVLYMLKRRSRVSNDD